MWLQNYIGKKVGHLFNTKTYQFGFKSKHSIDLFVFAMKKLLAVIILDRHQYMHAT